MGAVGALVAEVAVDLEDPLDTTDHSPLEEQLWGDAQVEVDVERVGMGDERPGGRTTVQRLQHRCLDLQESPAFQRRAQFPQDRDACSRHLAGLGPHDEVDVPLADTRFLVHFLVRHRKWAQRLARHLPRVGEHAQFPATRADHLAVYEDEVTEVHVGLPGGQRLLTHAVQADHGLQLRAVTFLKCCEAQLPGVADEDHPAGDADDLTCLGVGLEVWVLRAELGQ